MRSEVTDDSVDRGRRDEEFLGLRAMTDYDLSVSLLAPVYFPVEGGTKSNETPVK
jgi:hypothetical protein